MSYNAAIDLLDHNIAAGRGDKTAFIDKNGSCTYREFAEQADRAGNALLDAGIRPEQRVVMCMHDTIDFPAVFLGAIKAGIIPVPISTRLTTRDYTYILEDSRAAALVVSESLLGGFSWYPGSRPGQLIVSGEAGHGHALLSELCAAASDSCEAAVTMPDDMCFWLYTSGTTGAPKGVVHVHSSMMATVDAYATPTLNIAENDVVFSAAKLFFAYGLGNGLTFPMAAGATAVLLEDAPTPEAVADIFTRHGVTLFFGVPTLYGMMLASDSMPAKDAHSVRLCISAGEALPGNLLQRWREQIGVEILDGLGSTEMLHIFLTNHAGEVRANSSGRPVDGYRLRILDDDGNPAPDGEFGHLEVAGPTAAIMYWNQRDKSRETFRGEWTRTGDKYQLTEDGYYEYGGRADDMLKVGGIYVSPFEVEGALAEHPAVLEVAVVGHPDQDELVKPKAFVALAPGSTPSEELTEELQAFVRERLAPYKYPRWIEFIEELPKTATGKIQRYKLRA